MQLPLFRELWRRWRRQIGVRHLRPHGGRPRDAGAIGFLVDGDRRDGLVELKRLLVVVVYDVPSGRPWPSIRVAGYRAARVPHGVLWGGADNLKILKDLSLCPRPGGRGHRLDSRSWQLTDLALRLDYRLEQAVRYQPIRHNRQFRFPRLWAGYSAAPALELRGAGPEFEALCEKFQIEPEIMFQKFARLQDGLVVYPLEWVTSALDAAVTVFAELEGLPRRQIFQLDSLSRDLTGYSGASGYDFSSSVSSQFRVGETTSRDRTVLESSCG